MPVEDSENVAAAIRQAVHVSIQQADRPIAFGLQPILEVHLRLTNDAFIQRLNREHRGLDSATDVLSFSQIEGQPGFVAPPSGSLMLGDVVISLEAAQRQATGTFIDELRHLAVHGTLHLLGYDHQTDEDEARMNGLAAEALAASR